MKEREPVKGGYVPPRLALQPPDISVIAGKGTGRSMIAERQEIIDRINYFYKITGGYEFPNSAEGDILKLVAKHFGLIK